KTWLQNRLAWLDANIPGICTEIGIKEADVSLQMIHSYPNPFSNSFTIVYNVPENGKVKLELLNILGEQVNLLQEESKSIGSYRQEISSSHMEAGMYVVKLTVNDKVYRIKCIK